MDPDELPDPTSARALTTVHVLDLGGLDDAPIKTSCCGRTERELGRQPGKKWHATVHPGTGASCGALGGTIGWPEVGRSLDVPPDELCGRCFDVDRFR